MGILDKITGKASTAPVANDAKAKKTTPVEAPVVEAKAEVVAEVKVKSAEKVEKKPAKKIKTEVKGSVFGVLISPIVTEKSATAEQHNKYTFAVTTTTTKNEIKKAIETRYGVKPVAVNIVNNEGKYKRYGKYWGKRIDTKKAIVTLPKGKSINVYEAAK